MFCWVETVVSIWELSLCCFYDWILCLIIKTPISNLTKCLVCAIFQVSSNNKFRFPSFCTAKSKMTYWLSCSNMVEHFMMSFLWTGPMLTPEYCKKWEQLSIAYIAFLCQIKTHAPIKKHSPWKALCGLVTQRPFLHCVTPQIVAMKLKTPKATGMIFQTEP